MSEVSVASERGTGCEAEERCSTQAKWGATVDDVVVPMPQRQVPVEVIKTQASVPADYVLVRDHNSPQDVIIEAGTVVDLAAGNVFYRLKACEVEARGHCTDQPKLAFIVDDRAEITTRGDQTGESLRALFGLTPNVKLVRDFESPNDEDIAGPIAVRFVDGPVFYTRKVHAALSITVNARVFTEQDGVKSEMKGAEIAALVYRDNPSETRVFFVSEGGREIALTETVHIKGCEVFEVARKAVTGGFESARVKREIDELLQGGANVTIVTEPVAAVIYHGLKDTGGRVTDVLVPVPGGYPGSMIDWAYLPEGSPLIGHVKGSPQDHRIQALGQQWRQISYHPHNGGGAPAWNPTVHGFHTYLGEVLSWLRDVN